MTRNLALPIGMHLGWNWAQGHLLGFGFSGLSEAGWFRPLFQGKAEWIPGGSFGVVVDLMAIALLWKWKGPTNAAPATDLVSESLSPESA